MTVDPEVPADDALSEDELDMVTGGGGRGDEIPFREPGVIS